MENMPAFSYPSKFAEISGLSVKEIRTLCQRQVIPNERTKRGFRIDVKGALAALQSRAAEFTGHAHQAQRIKSTPIVRLPASKAGSFRDMLASLQHA